MDEVEYQKLSEQRTPIFNPKKKNLQVSLTGVLNPSFKMPVKTQIVDRERLVSDDDDYDTEAAQKVMITRLTMKRSNLLRHAIILVTMLVASFVILLGLYGVWGLMRSEKVETQRVDDVKYVNQDTTATNDGNALYETIETVMIEYKDDDGESDYVPEYEDVYYDYEIEDENYELDWENWDQFQEFYDYDSSEYDDEYYDSYENDDEEYDSDDYDSYENDDEEYDSDDYDSYENDDKDYYDDYKDYEAWYDSDEDYAPNVDDVDYEAWYNDVGF